MQTELQALRGVTSINLHRGGKRLGYLRGYGLYVTNDRLMGVRISNAYQVLLLAP